jgi:ribosomal protein S18 acetylase RimI-like enzyme/2'-5' RNA ligase
MGEPVPLDLEAEFGWLLDGVENYINENPDEFLEHFGVKGMKWGVRKSESTSSELKSLGPQTIVRKTANGDELTLSQKPPSGMHKLLARMSPTYREEYSNFASFSIKDKDGKKVGDAQVAKKSKDELYLIWLGVKKSERGKGYASAVMKAAEDFGKKEGFKKLTLEVPGNAPDARHIYENLGFKYIAPVNGGAKDPVWGGLGEMVYTFSDAKHAAGQELIIVALPREDETVRQYSSEKEPHLTLLYLGKANLTPTELAHITEYIGHAASQISSFGMEVERRGELGPNKADVLFFVKRWAKDIVKFRGHLLQNEIINRAYLSADQFPEWTPHLTMGYPDAPAKPDKREYQRYSWVGFDRIALWTGDSTGPTFQLKANDYDMEVAMSQTQQGADVAADILEHYGVKGMHWGKKKGAAPGSGHPASSDATKAADAAHIVKKSGVKALSNDQLKDLVTRMDLEQKLVKLQPASKATKVRKAVTSTLQAFGKQQVNMAMNQLASQQIANVVAKTKK